MGHERTGSLPRTARWRDIVSQYTAAASSADQAVRIADATIACVRASFEGMADDAAVQRAFQFLIAVPRASAAPTPEQTLAEQLGILGAIEPTPLQLAKALNQILEKTVSTEHGRPAAKAAADALAAYKQEYGDHDTLFPQTGWESWRSANTGSGFCQLSRLFFAKLTERFLRYHLDREAPAELASLDRVEALRRRIDEGVSAVAKHAFETSKITQSFAAGWHNKHTKAGLPSLRSIRSFLHVAFNKVREELRREAAA